jgi:hypothetical protein
VIFANGLSVVHLGDGDFGGTANSKLQAHTSGATWPDTFTLDTTQKATFSSITITLFARGVETNITTPFCDQISLGNMVGASPQTLTATNPDGSFTQISHTFPLAALTPGTIHLQISSGTRSGTVCGPQATPDLDDFEIVSVTGKFNP